MNWVWGWNKINRPCSSAVITWSSITLEQSKVDWLLHKCSWWIFWLLLYKIVSKSIFLRMGFPLWKCGVECSYKLNSSPRQTLYDKKKHICSTPEGLLNYCKLVTSLTAPAPLGAFQLLNREKVLPALLKYCHKEVEQVNPNEGCSRNWRILIY